MKQYFKIGELAQLYGISVDSLRYYEKLGLLSPGRAESGYRYYSIGDIWKLNTIRDLRGLDFSMEQIRQYLQHHSVESTLELLDREKQSIEERIAELDRLKRNADSRMAAIRQAVSLPVDQIQLETLAQRRCYTIPKGYTRDQEMDVLMRRLQNLDQEHLYLIGSNQIGTAISLEDLESAGEIRYRGVFVMDDRGGDLLPAGEYLTVTYRGDYQNTGYWAQKLMEYAGKQGLCLMGDLLEILLIDIHTSEILEEHLTQLQVRVEKV